MPPVSWRTIRSTLFAAFLVPGALALFPPAIARAGDLYVAPGGSDGAECSLAVPCRTPGGALARARAGDTVSLAAGVYAFRPASRYDAGGVVTVRAQPGATVSLSDLRLDAVRNLRIEGMTIDGGSLLSVKNVTFAGNTFTGVTVVFAQVSDGNVVFDGNDFPNVPIEGGFEGRIWVNAFNGSYANSDPAPNVTIRGNHFHGGNSDGIQLGGEVSDVLVEDNEFDDLHTSACPTSVCSDGYYHTDPIQIVGAHDLMIRDNWFHNTSTGVMMPEGGDANISVQNNVFSRIDQFALDIGYKQHLRVVHNTFDTQGLNALRIVDNHSNSDTPSSDIWLRDNVCTQRWLVQVPAAAITQRDYNVGCSVSGAHDLAGPAVFTGGAHPSSVVGFTLTTTSPGHAAASDGTDMGAAVTVGATVSAAATATSVASAEPPVSGTPGPSAGAPVASLAKIQRAQAVTHEAVVRACLAKRRRVGVRLKLVRRRSLSRGRVQLVAAIPKVAVERGRARVRISVRRASRWRLVSSRRVKVRKDGTVRIIRRRALARRARLSVVVRCSKVKAAAYF